MIHLPTWVAPVTGALSWLGAYLVHSPNSPLRGLLLKGATIMENPNLTADTVAFAQSLVSAVVSTHDAEARKAAVVAAVDANKDKLATDLGASPLEVAALNWVSSDGNEGKLYDAFDQVAEQLVHEVADGFFTKLVPTLKAALHLG